MKIQPNIGGICVWLLVLSILILAFKSMDIIQFFQLCGFITLFVLCKVWMIILIKRMDEKMGKDIKEPIG